jgi:hypothetical protein
MAMHIHKSTLKTPLKFKRVGQHRFVTLGAGNAVTYARSLADPGVFVIWAHGDMHWYHQCDAVQLPTLVSVSL